jgi:hypothetical protein
MNEKAKEIPNKIKFVSRRQFAKITGAGQTGFRKKRANGGTPARRQTA